jgi:hypothetical protein
MIVNGLPSKKASIQCALSLSERRKKAKQTKRRREAKRSYATTSRIKAI